MDNRGNRKRKSIGTDSPKDTWVIVATGQSLTQEDVDYCRGKATVAVVSNAYNLAPWADYLISHDRAWWNYHKPEFNGVMVAKQQVRGAETYSPHYMPQGCNSGLMAMFYARDNGAKRIFLLGFDMKGTHYFGAHPDGLKNTTAQRFKQHIQQFTRFSGCEVINCNPNSALTRYPFGNLREVLN